MLKNEIVYFFERPFQTAVWSSCQLVSSFAATSVLVCERTKYQVLLWEGINVFFLFLSLRTAVAKANLSKMGSVQKKPSSDT